MSDLEIALLWSGIAVVVLAFAVAVVRYMTHRPRNALEKRLGRRV